MESMDTFAEVVRLANFATSSLLLLVTLAAIVWRWRRMDPVERLFSMSLAFLIIYVLGVTRAGLEASTPFRWYLVVLSVANIWMITTVIVLTVRRPKDMQLPPAVATSQGWDTLTEDDPDRPEPS